MKIKIYFLRIWNQRKHLYKWWSKKKIGNLAVSIFKKICDFHMEWPINTIKFTCHSLLTQTHPKRLKRLFDEILNLYSVRLRIDGYSFFIPQNDKGAPHQKKINLYVVYYWFHKLIISSDIIYIWYMDRYIYFIV